MLIRNVLSWVRGEQSVEVTEQVVKVGNLMSIHYIVNIIILLLFGGHVFERACKA